MPKCKRKQREHTEDWQTIRMVPKRNYRLFWFGQMISLIGSWIQSIGQA